MVLIDFGRKFLSITHDTLFCKGCSHVVSLRSFTLSLRETITLFSSRPVMSTVLMEELSFRDRIILSDYFNGLKFNPFSHIHEDMFLIFNFKYWNE